MVFKNRALKRIPLSLIFGALLWQCAGSQKPEFDERFQIDDDQRPLKKIPETAEVSDLWHRHYDSHIRQVYRLIDLPGHAALLGSKMNIKEVGEAQNINSWDEVPDSSWFTNRIGRGDYPLEKVLEGPHAAPPPNVQEPWSIVAGKTAGFAVGFVVRDGHGDKYFIKFDPKGYDELNSAAEYISTLILHGAGYNVPANYITHVPKDIFSVEPGATTKNKYNQKIPLRQADVDGEIAKKTNSQDGLIRVVASRAIEGIPVGQFYFDGKRRDDPNDRFMHEHRRELRGLRIISAWLNNHDIRPMNTFDTYVGEPGQGHIEHYLLDFGSSLGASGASPKNVKQGNELYWDWTRTAVNIFTFGARKPNWETIELSAIRSIGRFNSINFNPKKWRPTHPKKAFELMTLRDAFWATKIILSFTDQMIFAIVDQAQYSSELAAHYVALTLMERRDIIGRYYLSRVTPLDNFSLTYEHPTKHWRLGFEDLAVSWGLVKSTATQIGVAMGASRDENRPLAIHMNETGHHTATLPARRITQIKEPFAIHLEVTRFQESIGRGVEVQVYCATQTDCVIIGIDR